MCNTRRVGDNVVSGREGGGGRHYDIGDHQQRCGQSGPFGMQDGGVGGCGCTIRCVVVLLESTRTTYKPVSAVLRS